MELEWLVLSFVCFVLSDFLNWIREYRGSSWQELECSGHLSSLHHQLVKHLSPQNVIFPVKMTPIHKVWSWSLGGQGVILTGAGMFRTSVFMGGLELGVWEDLGVILTGVLMFRIPVIIVWTTFVKHLSPQNVIFPIKMTPVNKVWSWSLRG